VDKDDELGRFAGGFGFAQADGFGAFIVQLIILRRIVANNFCASFGEQVQLVAVALFVRAGNHTQNKLIFLEILSGLIEGLFILQFCAIRLIEYFLGVVSEFLGGLPIWQAGDGVLRQFVAVVVCTLFEEAAKRKLVYDKRFAMIRVMSSCCSWGEKARTSATMEVSRECGGCSRWRRRDSTKRSSPNSSSQWSMDSVTPSV
jgi:hypothetical protein